MKWLGLEIERKTDILALAAFVIALGGTAFQVSAFVRGAEITIVAPDQILFTAEKYSNGHTYVRFAARMAYVNSGQQGYNGVVRKELLKYTLDGVAYTQIWQKFTASDADESDKLVMNPQGTAIPLPVEAGSSLSHETLFTPLTIRCPSGPSGCAWANYLEWNRFLTLIRDRSEITFRVTAELYDGTKVEAACTVDLNADVTDRLEKSGWYAPTCWSGD
jgi:hypothetical protein